MKPQRTRYSQVEMPKALMDEVEPVAASRHHSFAYLARSCLAMATRFAAEGRGEEMLPLAGSGEKTGSGFVNLQWAETREDSAETVRLLKAAGSSRPAVLAAFFRAYIEADGSLVRLVWPRREAVQRAAA